jgi:predicted NBD/HSP70 family sugar kinase/uncharacterized phosphosugar-binding protein
MSTAGRAPRYAVGIDLGGTNVKAVAVLESGQVLQRAIAPTSDDAAPGRWIETIRGLVSDLQSAQGYPACGIGVGAPGLASPDGRRIAYMRGRLAGLEGLDWRDALQVSAPVPVMNDAHAALWGEAWRGAAAGCREAVLLTLGTGVGGAMITGGRLLRGENERAGHWGHISVDLDGPPSIASMPGSLEGAIGNCSLGARSGGRFHDTRTLVDAHLRGDAEATRIWLRSVRALGVAIASIVNAVDPERVILGGGIAEAGDALFGPLRLVLDRVEWRPHGASVRVVRAELGDQAGALGAARAALELSSAARDTPGGRYLARARELVEVVEKQHTQIARAADLFAAAILKGRVVHVFGTGHSRIMVEEMWPRYGSFPGFHPIVELSLTFHTQVVGANGQRQAMFLENVPGLAERILRNFQLTAQDAALVVSSSGGNVVSVEMAEGFQRRGLPVVALISKRHSEATKSRDPRGCRVQDFADVVLDTGAPPGDAMVDVPGLGVPVAPGSTVGGCLIVNALKAEVAARLAEAGAPPPVLSGAAIVGEEASARMFEAAYDEHARRIGPLYSRPRDDA